MSVAGAQSEGEGGEAAGPDPARSAPVSWCCPSGCWLEAGSDEDHSPPAPLQLGVARRPSSGRWDVGGRGACAGKGKEGEFPPRPLFPFPLSGLSTWLWWPLWARW